MNEDLIQLPEVKDIKEMLTNARADIQSEIEEDPELVPLSKLLLQVIDVLEEKTAKQKNLNKLADKEKIDVAAHLSFLQGLLEDFFFYEEIDFEEGEGEFSEDEEENERK